MRNFFKSDYKRIAEKAKYRYNREQAVRLYHTFLDNVKLGICETTILIDNGVNLDEAFITKYLNGKNIHITFSDKDISQNCLGSNMYIKVLMKILK